MSIESVQQLSSALISYVLEPAIRSAALAVAIYFLLFAFRIRDISIRLTIWKLVLYVALAMPLLPALLPTLPFSLLQPSPQNEATALPLTPPTRIASEAMPADAGLPVDAVPTTLQDQAMWRSIDWGQVATVLYILIAAFMLVRFVVGLFLSRRLRRASQPITDLEATAMLREVAIGEKRMASIAESQAVTVPITLGLMRSIILLPTNWHKWETQKLRAVLAHEMAHVAKKDALVQMLSALHRCFFWFSPFSWWLHRRIVELAEQAADNRAVQLVSDRTYYAEVLLSFFKALKAGSGRARGLEVSMARGSAAERRVDGILTASPVLPFRFRKAVLVVAFLVIFPMVYLAAAFQPGGQDKAVGVGAQPVASRQQYMPPSPETDLALEIVLPNDSNSFNLRVSAGRSMTIIRRHLLTINDPTAAADFTGLDAWADREGDSIRVRLSVIYNDLSNHEWWKDKKEKIVGSYLIKKGESVRPSQLVEFGIAPVELKAMRAEHIIFQPGEGPRIINNTRALEVIKMEKSLDFYYLSLRNTSEKNIVSFEVNYAGRGGVSVTSSYGSPRPLIPAGGDYHRETLYAPSVETNGITIGVVVFEDRTFEGDASLAAHFLANDEGMKIGVPGVLRLVKQTLKADDSEMQGSVSKLEAQLWALPEAIDKARSLEVLRSKFASFEESAEVLYERSFKGGIYQARAFALQAIGSLKRDIERTKSAGVTNRLDADWEAQRVRRTLTDLKEQLEQTIANR